MGNLAFGQRRSAVHGDTDILASSFVCLGHNSEEVRVHTPRKDASVRVALIALKTNGAGKRLRSSEPSYVVIGHLVSSLRRGVTGPEDTSSKKMEQ